MRRLLDRLLRRLVRNRRARLAVRFPDATFHFEVMPDGIVRPVLDDPRILNPHVTEESP